MSTTTTNNNILPLFQSIRSPRSKEADDLTRRFVRIQRAKLMAVLVFLSIGVFSFYGETTSMIMKPNHAMKVPSEPNIFTPRIVMQAMEETERRNNQS
mmetsp:Transcript_33528/g.38184  ORF Transcript_33528/g.38184 Transcript_33528/m.38184 type:complete len:98 (-) Transcript_33528:122-415(-)